MHERRTVHKGRARAAAVLLALALSLWGCKGGTPPRPAPPPPQVSVITVAAAPVTIYEDYVGRTAATETVEIRARVGGILERQAFADGAAVKKGTLLYVIDPTPFRAALAQAQAGLAQARANLTNAEHNLARQKQLADRRLVSRETYDAALAAAQSGRATVAAQQAQVEQARLNLGYAEIRAPSDGVMSRSLVQPGSLINASQTLLDTLYSVDPIDVYFALSEQRMLQLEEQGRGSAGGIGAISFGLRLSDGSEYRFPGKLDFLDPRVDETTGTVQARIAVPNPEGFLRPGQFVRVVAPIFTFPQAIRVPQAAVQELQGLKSVFVVGADGRAASRPITARYRSGEDWVVEQGLRPGEEVVVEGTEKVRPGAPVHAVVAASPGGAATAPVAQGR